MNTCKADFHSLETFENSKLNKKALGVSSFGIKSNSYHLFGVNMTNISCGYQCASETKSYIKYERKSVYKYESVIYTLKYLKSQNFMFKKNVFNSELKSSVILPQS